jgi:hypothetical protein
MAEDASGLTGGCLCGAVRYEIAGAPGRILHCHCSMCRKAAGAVMLTFVSCGADQLIYTKGAPATHRSSEIASRGFCGDCGSPLTFAFDAHPERISVTAGTLDDPNAVAPSLHVHDADRIGWLHIDDGLPRLDAH